MKRRHSIRMRIVVVPLILVFAAVLLLSTASIYVAYTRTLEQKRLAGLAVAQQIKARVQSNALALSALEGVTDTDAEALQEELSTEKLVVDVVSGATLSYAHVFNAQNDLEVSSGGAQVQEILAEPGKREALQKRSNYVFLGRDPVTKEMVWDILLPYFVAEEYAGAVNVGINLEIVRQTLRSSLVLTVAIAGSTYVVLALVLTLVASRLVRSIDGITGHINLLERKVLHRPVPEALLQKKDEIGMIAKGIQSMQEALSSVLAGVFDASAATAKASQELSISTGETSASIEEVASTANHFASTVQSMGDNVARMVQSAQGIQSSASAGKDAVTQAVGLASDLKEDMAAMAEGVSRLGERSREIGQIVEVITAIADQTNLLALNAAIEAARAGEHGRGFAVVAEEVRQLAEQAAGSSNQITGLVRSIQTETEHAVQGIKQSAADAEESATAVERGGELLNSILEQIADITNTILEVSNGIEMINAGSEELAATTEEQSASMDTIAVAAQELSSMSQRLQQLVQEFELGKE
jgi:methyl-accepting chemotaxis protein